MDKRKLLNMTHRRLLKMSKMGLFNRSNRRLINMTRRRLFERNKRRLASMTLAMWMALGTIANPVTAYAVGNTGDTTVKVKANDSNLMVIVPTVIPFMMNADGTLVSSTEGVGNIINKSNFSIYLSSVAVTQTEPFNIVADATSASEDNEVSFKFGRAGHEIDAKKQVVKAGQYNLSPTGTADGSDKIPVTASGNAKNVKANILESTDIANISWTFKLGQADLRNTQVTGDEATEAEFEYITENGGCTITKYKGKATHVVIPAYIDGLPVKQISRSFKDLGSSSSNAPFHNQEQLQSIVLPNTLEIIESNAFIGCINLSNISIPKGVTTIGENAFTHCKALTNLVIPDSVTDIRYYAFSESGLLNLVIPKSVTTLPIGIVQGCKSLKSVSVPDSVTTIGEYAFMGCTSLDNLVIPDSVTQIKMAASKDVPHVTYHGPATNYYPEYPNWGAVSMN